METTLSTRADTPVLGRYRLLARLGGGGFGVVWHAHDEKLDREVAVKRIPTGDADVAERARREGLAAARLQHPGIVALYETGADDDAVFLVSELVHGRTLAQRSADGELSDRDVLRIGVVLCDALAHAHQRGVVHRDVKPANVIVPDDALDDDEGRARGPAAKLTDFGIARLAGDDALTRTGDVVGTLAYMAPEQAEGKGAGPEADLYALGLCVYEALSGVNPVRAKGATATVRRIGRRLPDLGRLRRDLPLDLCAAIDTAVDPDPAHRGTLKQLRGALNAALGDVGDEPGTIEGSPLEPLAPVLAPRRTPIDDRGWSALGAAAAVGAALALGPQPPAPAWQGALVAAVAVAALPRLGWLAAAAAVVSWLLAESSLLGGLAAAALVPTALALRHAPPRLWSLPAAAPALGALGLAGAFPALAALAPKATHRALVGALGAWWVLLGEGTTARTLLLGDPPDAAPPAPAGDVLWAALSSGALGVAAVWGAAAAVLPLLVRGRSLAVDVVLATTWAAGTAACTQALLDALTWSGGPTAPRGLVAGAVLCGALAVLVRRHSRDPRDVDLA
ncbi:serine/threonine-protein kinase [Conexibacter sp. SYSU D00693]|uniref:serine/threonine-protein kinase n=1 Tax=Conexibacter sp. SYSU D00693 TaxID=2812560 RepID=UPI00196B4473|nr:serine/threonine-protein kinase [Conexibacter sp. SYSU D00693]